MFNNSCYREGKRREGRRSATTSSVLDDLRAVNGTMNLDRKLIHLVEKHDYLYNPYSSKYCDNDSKDKAWSSIGNELNIPDLECRKKWKNIRDSFRKATRLRQRTTSKRPIKFEKELMFLKPHVQYGHQKSSSNYGSDIEDIDLQNVDSQQKLSTSQLSDSQSEAHLSMSETLNIDVQPIDYEDTTDCFFMMISRKVKEMPKRIQAEIERGIFRIVNEAEMKLAEDRDINPMERTPHSPQTESPATLMYQVKEEHIDEIYIEEYRGKVENT